MKQVEYFGITYQVPDDAVAIATDMDGGVYSYLDTPTTEVKCDGGWWIGTGVGLTYRRDLSEIWDSSLIIIQNSAGE